MKTKYSTIEINWKDNDKEYITFFAIPFSMEKYFLNEPENLKTSLDARELYCVESLEYEINNAYHEEMIDKEFETYTKSMMGSLGNPP